MIGNHMRSFQVKDIENLDCKTYAKSEGETKIRRPLVDNLLR